MTQEEIRLSESGARKKHWKRWGPYLSERAWGTVREDYSSERHRLGVSVSRPRPFASLSLERRRTGWHQRPEADDLFCPGSVERARSHPERTDFRFDRQRGQSRRGREGVLLLPRLNAHALLHEVPLQVSAGGISLRSACGRKPAARQEPAGVRAARHRSVQRRPLLSMCSWNTPRPTPKTS